MTTGVRTEERALATRSVEALQVFERPAPAYEKDDVRSRAVRKAQSPHDRLGAFVTLNETVGELDPNPRRATPKRPHDVLKRRTARARHDRHTPNEPGKRRLSRCLEKAFRFKLRLEFQERFVKRPESGAAPLRDANLQVAPFDVNVRPTANLDLVPLPEVGGSVAGRAREVDAGNDARRVLQTKVRVAGRRAVKVGRLAGNPKVGKEPLERPTAALERFRDGEGFGIDGRLGLGCKRGQARPVCSDCSVRPARWSDAVGHGEAPRGFLPVEGARMRAVRVGRALGRHLGKRFSRRPSLRLSRALLRDLLGRGLSQVFEPLANCFERPKARLPARARAGGVGKQRPLDRLDVAERILGIEPVETFDTFEAFDVRNAIVGGAGEGRHGKEA